MFFFDLNFFYLYLIFMFCLFLSFDQYLSVLILIEFMILCLFFEVVFCIGSDFFSLFLIYFLVVVVCESCMGISLFICMCRLNGNSYFSLNNFVLC